MTSDEELVQQALAGQSEAYAQLARRWSARVVAFCHARVGCGHAAEDLAQETLLRGLRGLHSLHDADRFGAWLRGIAHRVCLDWHNSKASKQRSFSSLSRDADWASGIVAEVESTSEAAERQDDLNQLMSHVEQLPEDQREVLMLYYYDDVTYQDLATLLGVSVATINARLTQARATLRRRLGCSNNSPRPVD